MGELSEDVMFRMWYPDGEQPQTITPRFLFLGRERFAPDKAAPVPTEPMDAPVLMQLHPGTQGSSLEYRVGSAGTPDAAERLEAAPWKLYRTPVRLPHGDLVLQARASRIGYKTSEVAVAEVTVREA